MGPENSSERPGRAGGTTLSGPSPRVRLAHICTALAVAAALTIASTTAASATPRPEPPAPVAPPGRYIVTLKDKPIATYGGQVKGLAATRPANGRRLDVGSLRAEQYRAFLERKQSNVAARVGAEAVKHFAVSVNGFATTLTPDQVRALERAPGVQSVTKELPRRFTDDKFSVDFLKLTGSTGLWSALGGKARAGRGVVVGIIDSGYWPESRSLAGPALGTAKPTAADPFRPYKSGKAIIVRKADGGTFKGTCQPGRTAAAKFAGSECNSKVVGARYFSTTYESQTAPRDRTDYLSPRDGAGHGTHVASTAAGNAGVAASVDGTSFGAISGVAPAAKVAIYKVGFTSSDSESAAIYPSDAIDAIDAAITDGVDVLNYSVSGSDSVFDPVDLAFLSAASAGIFVATSAGNSGPGVSTLNHVVPWLTTVGASTVAPYEGTVTLGNGAEYAGPSTTVRSSVSGPMVTASAVKLAAADADEAALCAPGTLNRTKATGRVVVCDRGVVGRVDKSAEVKRVGGIGMVLANLTGDSVEGDTHAVPTVHLNVPAGPAVKAYARTVGATATLSPGNLTSAKVPYPQMAAFSSRGPSLGTGGDLLKPDIAAPGAAILAAVAPPSNGGRAFDFYSGTSMASPHVAGVAALFLGVHPRWSPMAVKSALMTTSMRVKDDAGATSRDYFAQGAGNVRPDRMFTPGVVFDAGDDDWLGFLEGEGFPTGTGVDPIDPSDYNSASISIGSLVGRQTVTRRVTAVRPGLYRASLSLPGVAATASPSILSFTAPGQTKTIEITFTQRAAHFDAAVFGSLYLRGGGTQARVPIVAVPQRVDAPDRVRGGGA